MEKPDCYECKHRGTLPGDIHIRCNYPTTTPASNPLVEMLAIFASVARVAPIQADTGLNVKGNPHGIRNGWFNWPYNFDPTWLLQCDGFEDKEEVR